MAILAHVIPFAVTARQIVFEKNEVAFLESFQPLEIASDLREVADVLMSHDERRAT